MTCQILNVTNSLKIIHHKLQLFENTKPYILKDAKVKMTQEIDDNIEKMIGKYGLIPNSLSPIDYIIAEARQMVREK